jgi:hypothetical protein
MDSVTPGKGDEMTLKTTGTFVSHCFANYSCPPADGVPRRSGKINTALAMDEERKGIWFFCPGCDFVTVDV